MNQIKQAKLDLRVLVQSFAIIFAITTEIKADSNSPKKANPPQNNNPKTSVADGANHRPRIAEGPKSSKPNPPTETPNNVPVSLPEVIKPTPIPHPKKPNNPPVSIPEVIKPTPIPLPKKPNNPPASIPEVVKPAPIPLPKKPNNPPVSIPEVVKPTPIPLPKKPNNPPVSIPEVIKPTPIPLPKKINNPPASIPEVVKPTPIPLLRPIVSDKKALAPTQPTKAPIQEVAPIRTYSDSQNRRTISNDQNFYHQQTVRDFYAHTRKYTQPTFRDQGYNNNCNTYSWENNNRYFYGYNYRNYNYITCYDRFNNRFSIITVPNENLYPPVVIQPYPSVLVQPYPIGYYQTFDSIGFLSPIFMLLRFAQGNYIW